jgi:gephyrin
MSSWKLTRSLKDPRCPLPLSSLTFLLPLQIRDSNRPALLAAFKQEGFPTIDLGIVKDSVEVLKARMLEAVGRCDVVITSGGVSMGEADYVKTILQEIGTVEHLPPPHLPPPSLLTLPQVHFGRLNMKPGKPTTFATINKLSGGQCSFFGLPGNPVSCLVCKALVVDPALKRLQGIPSKGAHLPSSFPHLLGAQTACTPRCP